MNVAPLLWVLVLVGGPLGASGEHDEDGLAQCVEHLAEDPQGWNRCACFYHWGKRPGQRAPARERLHSLAAEFPERPCPWFYLASMQFEDGDDPSEGFARAARLYATRGEFQGAFYAHGSLGRWFLGKGDFDSALAEMEETVAVARRLGDPRLEQAAEVEWLKLALSRGKDLAQIEARLVDLETNVRFKEQPALALSIADLLAQTRFRLGDLGRAKRAFDRLARHLQARGDPYAEATTRFHAALCLLSGLPSEAARAEAIERLNAARSLARSAGNLRASVAILHKLGELDRSTSGEALLRQSVDLARKLAEPSVLYGPLLALAERVVDQAPQEATRLLNEAEAARPQEATASLLAAGWLNRLRVAWRTAPPDEAFARSLVVLDEIERLRRAQVVARAEYFSLWLPGHQWLAGRLFAQAVGWPVVAGDLSAAEVAPAPTTAPAPTYHGTKATPVPIIEDRWINAAFSVIERMRARILLESTTPTRDPPAASPFATLEQVRAQLGPHEAMLSVQFAHWRSFYDRFEGGAWLLSIERERTRLYTLPDPAHVEPALDHFEGLFSARDGGEVATAAVLRDQLLAPALSALSPQSKHLIMIADGALHRLPLAALTNATDESGWAELHLSSAPSASLWLRWRNPARTPPPRQAALILAAPELDDALIATFDDGAIVSQHDVGFHPVAATPDSTPPAREASKPSFRETVSQPLPAARREGRRIRRLLGASSRLFEGARASEAEVKRAKAGQYSILHFAAHALVGDLRGQRSGILLAPGALPPGAPAPEARSDDGLLEPHEIAQLDWDGAVVVLAACRSGGGRLLLGEGFLSLAHAFFQAGARTVVASLWPLRDDEAERFFDGFYQALRRGETVAGAVALAQYARRADGDPGAAWAGVVALGDGTVRPFPEGLAVRGNALWMGATVALLLLVAVALGRRSV